MSVLLRAHQYKALAWLLLSPLAAFMALISTVKSDAFYYAQLVLFGAWSALGFLSGVAALLHANWVPKLRKVLVSTLAAYFAIALIVILSFSLSAFLSGGVANPTLGWVISAAVFLLLTALFVRSRLSSNQGRTK